MHLAAAHTGGEVGRVRNLLLGVLGQGLAVSGAEAAGLGGRVLGRRRPGPPRRARSLLAQFTKFHKILAHFTEIP